MYPLKGACACGKVTYTIPEELTEASICHCKLCQAWTGGIFIYVESKGVTFQGDLQIWNSSEYVERANCSTCHSCIYCKITAPGPMQNMYHVAAGTLEDWKDIKLENEIFIDRKPAGYSFAEKTSQKTMAEMYALWGVSDVEEKK